jgi:hypothetical protein
MKSNNPVISNRSKEHDHQSTGLEQRHPNNTSDEQLFLRFPATYQTPRTMNSQERAPSNIILHQSRTIQTPTLTTPANLTSFDNFSDKKSREDGDIKHHTLGQIAEQFQKAAKLRTGGLQNGDDDANLGEEDDDEDDHDEGGALGESTGRWTKQEHELFLEALKKYGKVC